MDLRTDGLKDDMSNKGMNMMADDDDDETCFADPT